MSHLEHVGETKPSRRREKTAIRKILARSSVRRDKKVIWLLSGGGSQSQSPNKKKKPPVLRMAIHLFTQRTHYY